MNRMSVTMVLAAGFLVELAARPAGAVSDRPWVGDPVNGKKLYTRECAACHGDDAAGGRTGISLADSGHADMILDDAMFGIINVGQGLKQANEHQFGKKNALSALDIWDVIAHIRARNQGIDEFFPQASRYVAKLYTIDNFGLERIKKATGKDLTDKTAAVFTFYSFPDEDGHLSYVPQDPIKLDQLKKKNKIGYLVFLPFETEGFKGELGIGMDATGKMTKVQVHSAAAGAELLNKSLTRFVGLGKKGQSEAFKIGGGPQLAKLADDVFRTYLRAMETVTMFDREENDRTWAEE